MISNILFVISDFLMLVNNIRLTLHDSSEIFQLKKYFPIYIIHSALGLCFSLYFSQSVIPIQIVLLSTYYIRFVIIPFFLSRKFTLKLFYLPLLLLSIDSLLQSCIYWVATQLSENANEAVIDNTVSVVWQIGLLLSIYYIHKHNNKLTRNIKFGFKLIPKSVAVLVLLCAFVLEGIISLITLDTVQVDEQKNITVFFLVLFVMLIFVIMTIFLISSASKRYFEDTSALLEKQIKNQISHYEALDTMRKEYHAFRHDYLNHLKCIRSLIQSGKNIEAEEYITELSNVEIISNPTFESGNHILDAIISDKIAEAEKLNIQIIPKGIFSDSVNPVDVCTIFSNLIDNSIEACSKLSEPSKITVDLKKQQGYQLISIRNPYSGTVNGNLITTKLDKEHHGFGISNVKNAVNHYDGEFISSQNDGVFSVDITLKI